jgi:hypothetical protein
MKTIKNSLKLPKYLSTHAAPLLRAVLIHASDEKMLVQENERKIQ